MRRLALSSALVLSLALAPALVAQQAEAGFTPLFDGKSLAGWTLIGGRGEGYVVKDGVLYCAKGGGGKLLTDKEYSDFVLRFDFRMRAEGSNNGLGIRAPRDGDAAYQGIELQILDEKAALAEKWGKLKETQYHGSVYHVIPAKKGAQKPAGEWNAQESGCAHPEREFRFFIAVLCCQIVISQ